jgi:DNA-binding protein H-NS
MTTYQEYKAKIAELENLAESARKNEVTQAKEKSSRSCANTA